MGRGDCYSILLIFLINHSFALTDSVIFICFCPNFQGCTLSCSKCKRSIVYQAPAWGQLCYGICFHSECSLFTRVCFCLFQSSLLRAVLGELPPSQGQVSVHGRIAYVPQQPWVFSGTLRSNILFGKKYEEDRYEEVIKACALGKVSKDF